MACSWFLVATVLLVPISMSSQSGLLFAAASDATLMEVPEDGCVRVCGDVSIPWPFGLEPKCAWNREMVLTCNNTINPPQNETLTPPQLFTGNIPVFNISVERSTMIISLRNAVDCYMDNGTLFRRSVSKRSIWLSPSYTFSPTRSKFTVLGCDTIALLSDASDDFGSGCISSCKTDVNLFTYLF